jgi:hypothetical protein
MRTVTNSLAVLALLGAVLSMFAFSALLKMVRDLQAAVLELRAAGGPAAEAPGSLPELAAPDGRPTFALVVDAHCPACRDRARRLVDLAPQVTAGNLIVITADDECASWVGGAGDRLAVRVDPVLLGRMGVGVTPALVKFDPVGGEVWRRILADDDDLIRLLELTPARAGN